ncbi:MAG: triose-phosphate isomerase [Candidatus Magasanikbacteria bacterium]|nr:triose-phosphate isomerase [Candidatus Magasanikbacteria bacterium]
MKYIFGNWKMYLGYSESVDLAKDLALQNFDTQKVSLAVFPAAIASKTVADELQNSNFAVGAQDVMWLPSGAYTGAVSAQMFKDIGCRYALVGHSERRHIFEEHSDTVRKKLEASREAGLIPVLCVGETKEDTEQDKRQYRLKKQLMSAFEGLRLNSGSMLIAYEPVWAIGTGDACLPQDAEDIIGWIKQEIVHYSLGNVPVLYGGSVTAQNVLSYTSISDIDGVLVGGVSTKKDEFTSLIRSVNNLYV